jgi:hypothetical protein
VLCWGHLTQGHLPQCASQTLDEVRTALQAAVAPFLPEQSRSGRGCFGVAVCAEFGAGARLPEQGDTPNYGGAVRQVLQACRKNTAQPCGDDCAA